MGDRQRKAVACIAVEQGAKAIRSSQRTGMAPCAKRRDVSAFAIGPRDRAGDPKRQTSKPLPCAHRRL
jgi:hypothetical protein